MIKFIGSPSKIARKIFNINLLQLLDFACTLLGMVTLEQRREKLCMKFAQKKDLKSQRIMFIKANKTTNTIAKPTKVKKIICRTNRFRKSALTFLSSLLNNA